MAFHVIFGIKPESGVILMYAGLAVGILSGFMILKINSRRMFHDYLAKTKVVEYEEYMGENKSI